MMEAEQEVILERKCKNARYALKKSKVLGGTKRFFKETMFILIHQYVTRDFN
jgi:hypothetical protein